MSQPEAPSSNEKHMKPTDYIKSDVNILLLGESGVGKSTFINSFANYLEHDTMTVAIESELMCLIPAKFTIPDENFQDRIVEIGFDNNEDGEIGNSSTQGARAYVFPLKGEDRKIRLIDTPGIGDARGVERDEANFENILSYISQFKELHAICFLLKPNVSVINAYFNFCIKHLFSRLEVSASKNIIFIFTNSRSTFYRPGETLPVLRKILAEIRDSPPHVEIPCGKENIFCLDNEAFKFLVALKKGISFGDREKLDFAESWRSSVASCWNMLHYIAGDETRVALKPHETQNTLSVNEARRIIVDLSKPLADISDLIQDNLVVLGRHQHTILQDNLSIKEMQKSLYIPAINLRQKSLPQPVTVCTASKCSEICIVLGIKKYHYKQRCHNPCYLDNVPTELIGSPQLLSCAAIGPDKQCTQCKCDFSCHMHVLYETELVEDKLEDESVKTTISSKEDMIKHQYTMITKLQMRCKEYKSEETAISKAMAKFAFFLKENSISSYNDAYEDYIDYLIDRENALGPKKDKDVIDRYRELKKQHQHEKNFLDTIVGTDRGDGTSSLITPMDVFECVEKLYKLKHTGKKIRELHKKQQTVRKSEHEKTMEYYHPNAIESPAKKNDVKNETDDIQAKLKGLNLAKGSASSNLMAEYLSEYFKQIKGTEKNTPSASNKQPGGGAYPKNKNKNNAAKPEKKVDQGANNSRNPNDENIKCNIKREFNNLSKTNNVDPSLNQNVKRNQLDNGPNYQYRNIIYNNRNIPVNQGGNRQNIAGNYPNQYGNAPNQPGNFPNQFGNRPNQFGNHPNQFGNHPNQFGNHPNQFGNHPNQFGNHPNQFANNPNQFGNYPNQFGNNPQPTQNIPSLFSVPVNQPHPYGGPPFPPHPNRGNNPPRRGPPRGAYHNSNHRNRDGNSSDRSSEHSSAPGGHKRGGYSQFKRTRGGRGGKGAAQNREREDDSSDSDNNGFVNIRSVKKENAKPKKVEDDTALEAMKRFVEQQKKLDKDSGSVFMYYSKKS